MWGHIRGAVGGSLFEAVSVVELLDSSFRNNFRLSGGGVCGSSALSLLFAVFLALAEDGVGIDDFVIGIKSFQERIHGGIFALVVNLGDVFLVGFGGSHTSFLGLLVNLGGGLCGGSRILGFRWRCKNWGG
jgi:hypothetical protein